MATSLFSRAAPQEPAQRILDLQRLPPDSQDVATMLAGDPAPEVRAAAAQRCRDIAMLQRAWESETDTAVRPAIAASLGRALAELADAEQARALLEADACTDAIRSAVARVAQDPQRRALAIAGIRDEAELVELALGGEHAETRIAAAERVHSPECLKKLADAARNKDRGVARIARARIDAMHEQASRQARADEIIAQLEALAHEPGPILTAVVELDRRWQALAMSDEAGHLARFAATRHAIQARFDREQEEPRRRSQFDRRLRSCLAACAAPGLPDDLEVLRAELASLRELAQELGHTVGVEQVDQILEQIRLREEERASLTHAESLVAEAEQLAAGTSIDDASLQERWHALAPAVHTPALKRRFKTALAVIEQRRVEQQESARQESAARRHQLHEQLHAAEQALAAGQLHAARSSADEIKKARGDAGQLPKPTVQRVARLMQQLGDLERWESFGQRSARVQLCERAEALAAQTLGASQMAQEVQKLRDEWKTLDQQHAGVPKALWLRFDGACEKAYAPAARFFAEQAARNKEARRKREEFIAKAAEHGPTLLGEHPDWRAVEHWMRDTERAWREGDLGSVDPGSWKKLDAKLKTALAPVREAWSAAYEQAKAHRRVLIEEVTQLGSKAMERDTPSQVKAIQLRWQEHAKSLPLGRRDERELWEQFRAACDGVFEARNAKRKEDDSRKGESRRALEEVCAQIEKLALEKDADDQVLRRSLRDVQEQWNAGAKAAGPESRGLQSRFNAAKNAVDALLADRERTRKAAVWQTLARKERLCEELDERVRAGAARAETGPDPAQEQWAALPELPPAWEKKMLERRDAALAALGDAAAAVEHIAHMEGSAQWRREGLAELELALGLPTPAQYQADRLALQMKKLKERFGKAAASSASDTELLLEWCAEPGVCDALDRQRSEAIFSRMGRSGAKP
jgi:hypothetical protein